MQMVQNLWVILETEVIMDQELIHLQNGTVDKGIWKNNKLIELN